MREVKKRRGSESIRIRAGRCCTRYTVYAQRKPKVAHEVKEVPKRLIDQYTCHPFYGNRKMLVHLGRCGSQGQPPSERSD
jgi:hypothetical protein